MPTKYEIKKYLERKKSEALAKLKSAHSEALEQEAARFIKEWEEYINPIREYLGAADECLDKFIKDAGNKGVKYHERYSGPGYYIRSAEEYLDEEKLTSYFRIPSVDLLKAKQVQEIEETEAEFNRLIAVVGSLLAKDGIEILKNLGFDVSELFVEKETTAVTTVFDVRKLFITKEVPENE